MKNGYKVEVLLYSAVGLAERVIGHFCDIIPQSSYGKVYAVQQGKRYYQIADGHHRVEALRILGYKNIWRVGGGLD